MNNKNISDRTGILIAVGMVLGLGIFCLSMFGVFDKKPDGETVPIENPAAPMALNIPGWEGVAPATLCLDISQTYPEEWFGFIKETLIKIGADITPRQYSFPFEIVIPDIMQRIGVQVLEAGAACDATLALQANGRAQSARYGAIRKDLCYTSAQVDIRAELSDNEHESFVNIFKAFPDTPGMITSSNCPKQPYKAPFMEKSAEALTKTLAGIWGSDMASLISKSYRLGNDYEEAMADAAKELIRNPEMNQTPTEPLPAPTTQPAQ